MVLHKEQRISCGTPGCEWKEKQHKEGPRDCTVPLWVFVFMALFVLCHTAVDVPHCTGLLAVSWCWQPPQPSLMSCRAGPAVISLGGERRPASSAPPAPVPSHAGGPGCLQHGATEPWGCTAAGYGWQLPRFCEMGKKSNYLFCLSIYQTDAAFPL